VPARGVAEQRISAAMRARRSRSQHARRWERGRPARRANRARKKPTPLRRVGVGAFKAQGLTISEKCDIIRIAVRWRERVAETQLKEDER